MRQIMDEQEWWASDDPTSLLQWLQDTKQLNDRKSRLFSVACCRRVWHLLRDERSRKAVEVAEQAADGMCGQEEIMAAWGAAWEAANEIHHEPLDDQGASAHWMTESAAVAAAHALSGAVLSTVNSAVDAFAHATGEGNEESRRASAQLLAALLRELQGPLPFRPVRISPDWRTPAVLALATTIYDERRFQEMPVLADALENSGCPDNEVLAHCRWPRQAHARGCWCLDLLLERE
jgi:hypothetical protein